jgi:hypothetical protein
MKWQANSRVLAAVPALLKSELLPIRTYSTADGLAADHVDWVVSDSRGFLWFCTAEGLSRFDGNHFVSYGVSEGLSHQYVSSTARIIHRLGIINRRFRPCRTALCGVSQ